MNNTDITNKALKMIDDPVREGKIDALIFTMSCPPSYPHEVLAEMREE